MEEIREHLKRVLASPEFASAPRLARFLAFVVETALSGKGEQIKESLIAVEVYGRRPDYNPQIDSTVRVEAGRLRARLRRYYESGDRSEAVRIELPKGTYVPVFRAQPPIGSPAVTADPGPSRRSRFRGWPVLVTALALGLFTIGLSWLRAERTGGAVIESIAVLPFVNLSDDRAAGLFSDGLTEELTTFLGRDSGVRVTARTTMARYKNMTVDMSRLGKEHGVRAILEGSVRRDGDRLVVTTQLIDTRNGYHLWADRYERNAGDLAGAQSEVAHHVVSRLRNVVQGDVAGGRTARENDAQTLDLYHRAEDLLRIPVLKNGPPGKLPETVFEAVRLFRQVTARSPDFAKGWAGLAEAAEWEYELRGNRPPERLAEAKSAAQRAVKLAPDLVEGWTILTSILFYRQWDLRGAEAACRRAIELDPRNTSARQRYVDILRVQGRREEARFELEQAIRLQPAAAPLRVRRAAMLYEQGEYDQALAEATAAADLTNQMPAYPMTLWIQGLCLEQKGRLAEAENIFRSALLHQPHDPRSEPALGHLLARAKRTAEAEGILSELRAQLLRGRMTHAAQALVYTGLGRTEEALAALERGYKERDDAILFIALDPRLRPLHSHPRFHKIVRFAVQGGTVL
jgi:TolB-like protein/tetratricopeptide (TPR) repeat protein